MEAGSKNRFVLFRTTRQIHMYVIQRKLFIHSHQSYSTKPQETTAELNIKL